MDTPKLPVNYLEEGKRYLDDIEALGLRPAAFFWAYDRPLDTFVLVLITEEYDHVGPLELSRHLFKAHNAAVTPSTIDPLIIRMHSPQHQIVREMDKLMPLRISFTPSDGGEPPAEPWARAVTTVGGLEIDGEWVYRFDKPLADRKTVDILRRWHRFERNVDKAAA